MNITQLIRFLSTQTSTTSFTDAYWNSVQLLCRFDSEADTKGRPLYADHSRYKYHLRQRLGSDTTSSFSIVNNGTANYPTLQDTATVDVDSFIYLPNYLNHLRRVQEFNSPDVNILKDNSLVQPTYFETVIEGGEPFSLGTNNFTIELSFYTDELALAWSEGSQCLFCVGRTERFNTVNTNGTYNSYIWSTLGGYGIFIRNSDLFFVANGNSYRINPTTLIKKVWYSVAVVRDGNTLVCYMNGTKVFSYSFSLNLTRSLADNEDSTLERLVIGANPRRLINTPDNMTFRNVIDSSFSGGISNFRITKDIARYTGDFYSLKLPLPVLPVQNKLDSFYEQTLLNLPMTYDLYDYSKFYTQFQNKELLQNTVLDFTTGFFNLDGLDFYDTEVWTEPLNQSAWTFDFYLAPFINGNASNISYTDLRDWLLDYSVQNAYGNNSFSINIPIFSLIGDDNKVIFTCTFHIYRHLNLSALSHFCTYFSLQITQNGTQYLGFASEANVNLNLSGPPSFAPDTEIKFGYSSSSDISGMPSRYTGGFQSGFSDPNFHIAIQKEDNFIYFLLNGQVNKTLAFNGTLYNAESYYLRLGSRSERILGSKYDITLDSFVPYNLSLGIKGIRLTNAARYSTITANEYSELHSLHPLALSADSKEPPRARIIAIVRKAVNPTISTEEAEWFIFTTAQLENLSLNDFTLTQIEGVTGAYLVSIEKLGPYQYLVIANTGEGNGKLALNFVDDTTVYYKNTSESISNEPGELSISSDFYFINKLAPTPILTSGSSPYISSSFDVTISFNAAVATFDATKIGILNGQLSNLQIIDEVNNVYTFTITPIKYGTVTVQALEGTGVTDTGFQSTVSAPLVRVFADFFPILQVPFTINTLFEDFSPSKLVFSEVIPNNTQYSNTIYPVGMNSCLYVNPVAEQSGFIIEDFDALGSNVSSYSGQDWTIEWFYRGNTTSNKITHIMSIESAAQGFSIVATNGNIQVRRNTIGTTNLFPGVTLSERDTPSFVAWENTSFTTQQKFPHFAITKKGNIYRFYRNGQRIGLVESSNTIDITQGTLRIGYYQNRISDTDYYLSNPRITIGKALYTSQTVNIPLLPYEVLPNINDEVNLINYISIYSNRNNSFVAKTGDLITVYFTSILNLANIPTVTIAGKPADIIALDYNQYRASIEVEDEPDGEVAFSITIDSEPGIPSTEFTVTSNETKVIIDNTKPTISIGTSAPLDGRHIFDCYLTASEQLDNLTSNLFTLNNCQISNFYHFPNSGNYTFTVTALSTGSISVELEADSITDLAGNFNLASNILSRTCQVPAYVPDIYWSNVLLLLQPETISIVDESANNIDVEATNVQVLNDTSPVSLTRAMRFNGRDSSLTFTLSESLSASIAYTVEMFVYISSTTVFRLNPPVALPASNAGFNSFTASWQSVENASSYVIDVAADGGFNNILPAYKNKNVGNSTSFSIASNGLSYVPVARTSPIYGSKGFVAAWTPVTEDNILAYKLDVALDANFTNPLYAYNETLESSTSKIVGNLDSFNISSSVPIEDEEEIPNYNSNQGVIIKGLLTSGNYPKLYYFAEESTVRFYDKEGYTNPIVVEDVDSKKWMHIALVNDVKYTYLYVDGVYQDKVRNVGFDSQMDIGYDIGAFDGYITGIRITKNIARYTRDFTPPTLPYPKN